MVATRILAHDRFPIAILIVAVLAFILGIVLEQPTIMGGFQLGLFVAWIGMLLLAILVVVYELGANGGGK